MSTKKKAAAEDFAEAMETAAAEVMDAVMEAEESAPVETPAAEAEATDTVPAPVETPYAVEARRNYIYIGPTLPKGLLKSNTLLTGTMTEIKTYLHGAMEKYPDIIGLVVPTDRLAESRHMLRGGKGALAAKYDKVKLAIKASLARKE